MKHINLEQISETTRRLNPHVNSKHKSQTTGMNKTESRFARLAMALKLQGKIQSCEFIGDGKEVFPLGHECTYNPDFRVQMPDGSTVYVEVKGGHVWGDSRIKWKWAADKYPEYVWEWWQWKNDQWKIERYPGKKTSRFNV